MRVVSNTSPISYLVLIGSVDVLPQLFGTVTIPPAVRDELSDNRAPEPVRRWIADVPGWIEITVAPPSTLDTELSRLHAGEREAILLAEHLAVDLVLLDEKAAREEAAKRGLRITGLLGILDEAGRRNLINVPVTVERLRRTSFRVAPRLLEWLSDRHRV